MTPILSQAESYPDAAQRAQRARHREMLADEITQLAAHIDAAEYRFLVKLEEFDRIEGWAGAGIASCAHWLNWKCGIGIVAAREKVRVARALPGLPRISAAFRHGRVSYSKVRAMTREASAKNEAVLLNVALHGTASHVERQVRLYRQVKRAEALRADNRRQSQRELTWRVDEDGFWILRGKFSPEAGEVIARALESALEAISEEVLGVPEVVDEALEQTVPVDQARSTAWSQRRADALERLAESYLAGAEAGKLPDRTGGDRTLVHLHTTLDTLRAEGPGAEAEFDSGGHASAEASRRMACDASIVHWLETAGGQPLSVGRKTRTIPPAIRRALQRRDGGCRFPGCTATRFVDAHHVHHWADGGETTLNNLLLLCRRHHRLVHEGGFGLEARPGRQFRFTLPTGEIIPAAGPGRFRGIVSDLLHDNEANGIHITPHTSVPRWYGERMDAQMAVQGLIALE